MPTLRRGAADCGGGIRPRAGVAREKKTREETGIGDDRLERTFLLRPQGLSLRAMPDIPCPHCGQTNEQSREVCWACGQLLKGKDRGITWSQTTKIVVNGKEYARLEDVPEQFRALVKDSVGGGLADVLQRAFLAQAGGKRTRIVVNGKEYERVEDVPEEFRAALKEQLARAAPGIAGQVRPGGVTWKLSFGAGTQLVPAPGFSVPLPDGFRLDEDGGERRVTWRWVSWRAAGAAVFTVLWDGVLAFILHAVWSSKASFHGLPPGALAALWVLAAVGLALAYASAAHLVNRTSVRIGPARVSVRHGPLPWFGRKDVPRGDIDRVWSEKVGYASDEDTAFAPSVTYSVKLLLKGGGTRKLAAGLVAPEQALFLEQELRRP